MNSVDTHWMRIAIEEAQAGSDEGEVPVGAVVVFEDCLIARNHNRTEQLKDATAHAEMLVVKKTSEVLQRWRLTGTTIYVTLEPCPMCAMALILSRIDRVVIAAHEPKTGACGSFISILGNPLLNHVPQIEFGVCESESSNLLKAFFRVRRKSLLTRKPDSDYIDERPGEVPKWS